MLSLTLTAWAIGCGKSDKPKVEVAGPSGPQLGFAEGKQKSESAPIALTTSDGAGLTLVSLEARTVIEDPLAFTELHLKFKNPEPRRREGRFQIALPPAAAISRFAMRVGDELQEGEVVERLKAQQVYEDFLHRKQDPALLEKASGNEFSARVFPIEANAEKEIIVAYSEELAQRDQPYRLLIGGLPQLAHLKAEVLLGSNSATGLESSEPRKGVTRLSVEKRDFAPGSDLEVTLPKQKPFALRSGNLVVARVQPVPKSTLQGVEALTVLFDTSASRALGFAAQIERFGLLLAELGKLRGKPFELRVVAFDQDSEEIYRGPAADFGLREKGKLLAREALGATDLAQALTFLARKPAGHERVLVVGDGMVTAGDDDVTRLREAVALLSAHGVARLDVLAEGGIHDLGLLAELTHAGLRTAGVVLSARDEPRALAERLLHGARDRVEVSVSGASWVYPNVLEGVQAGDERLVFAELPDDAPVQIELNGAGFAQLPTLETPRPLLERAWARAKIDALTQQVRGAGHLDASERAERVREIVQLSTSQRVLSDYTALLVLESDWDYQRFGLAQNALTSILRVGDEGIELFDRSRPVAKGQQIARGGEAFEPAAAEAPAPAAPRRSEPSRPQLAEGALESEPSAEQAAQPSEERAEASRNLAVDKAKLDDGVPGGSGVNEAKAARARGGDGIGGLGASGMGSGGGGIGMPRASSRPEPAKKEASADVMASAGAAPPTPPPTPRPATSIAQADEPRPAVSLEPRAQLSLHSASGIGQAEAASVWRGLSARARACYARAEPRAAGNERMYIELSINDRGAVRDGYVTSGGLADQRAQSCVLSAARALQFPKPDGASASVSGGVVLSMAEAVAAPVATAPRPQVARPKASVNVPQPTIAEAYSGELGSVLEALRAGDTGSALALARAARERDPGDVLALVALGEVLEAQHEVARAARVYGSLIDLFPSRADLRRMAGERLERLATNGQALAIDSYRKAVAQRPDHPAGHRLLAYALLKQGERAEAFAALSHGLDQSYPFDRFAGVDRVLREDLTLIAAAWLRSEPDAKSQIDAALTARGLKLDTTPSLRFVLNWETDANDVDFHIYDGRGGHASYLKPKLASGGALYADVTTGYGPECFAIPGSARAYPYVLQAHYYARGPMGFGMGKLQAIEHDGKGGLTFREQPFVIMKDKAFVELLRLPAPLGQG